MKGRQILLMFLISAVTAFGSIWTYNRFFNKNEYVIGSAQNGLPANYAGFIDGKTSGIPADIVDFTKAANSTVPAVVHIKTRIPAKKQTNGISRRGSNDLFDQWFDDFFGNGYGPNIIPEQRASGSGVIISEDGYIVTNNHVITNGGEGVADEITVTLHNRKTYKARVIGRDPSSDLAVLKIDGNKFPFLIYGNSNNLQLGQWVLAVGYPLTLETTVTAGIVSATGRTININRRQSESPVESFIQTDAAVNQGNSGGALVNTNGELVGINSAILAPNGTYAGYSFAIPVTIVKKIVEDIVKFGDVQRGYLGITYAATEDMSEDQIKALGIPTNLEGVYVSGVSPDGGAASSGIKKGDVITKVNNVAVNSGLEMTAQIASYRPGDRVPITYLRGGKESTVTITLKKRGDVVSMNIGNQLGAELTTLDKSKARQYGIPGGVVVNSITEGGPIGRTRMQAGFIITSVNGQDITSVEELTKILANVGGPVKVEGIYPGYDGTYTYPLNLEQ
ncbi:trypsin-like peptidase domain-containing protein [Flavisolibacter tropicus]|uniref:Serine protease n=1 Tax=Flavisolibacter tropicus TaxID=1492898 RepID=A0A172TT96_9BACT|nr:trypsin-like peptidase domain-containing protein [Flavisolibacter tropicus]ANE50226.1 serine protease [Flavisolibacter tropicus]